MESHNVWDYVLPGVVNSGHFGPILTSKLFLKYSASGEYHKVKARLVAGGHRQGMESFGKITSPTVDISSDFLSLGLFTYLENCKFSTTDIPAAYLNSNLMEDLNLRLPKSVCGILVKKKPDLKRFQSPSGSIVVKLKRSILSKTSSS